MPPRRNDDSSLYSLETLHRAEVERAGDERSKRLAIPIDAGRSGTIHVRQVGSTDASTLLDAGARLTQASTDPSPRGLAPAAMYTVLGTLTGVVIALGALVVQGPPTVIVQRDEPASAVGSLSVSEVERSAVEGDLEAKRRRVPRRHAIVASPEPELEPELEPEPTRSPKDSSVSSKSDERPPSRPTKPKATKSKPASAPTKVATETPTQTKPSPGDPSVECILDPASCGLGAKKPVPQPSKPASSSSSSSLPDKLTSSALRNALADAKARAGRCGEMHVAPAGTKVSVRLSIAGTTGQVTQATPQSPHDNALGRCVANELAQAEFPRFSAPSMGVVYSVRL